MQSRRLSRALTLYDALSRLGLLQGDATEEGVLQVHLLGADAREGLDVASSTEVFAPLCELIATCGQWREVSLLLCGPNCMHAHAPSSSAGDGVLARECTEGGQPALRITYSCELYDECAPALAPPHLAVAFQAGLWGYDSWGPSIALLLRRGCPLVVTSYNELEAEEDEEVLQALGVPLRWLWRPQPNPWSSLLPEERRGHKLVLLENAWSQCVAASAEPLRPAKDAGSASGCGEAAGNAGAGGSRGVDGDCGVVRDGCRVRLEGLVGRRDLNGSCGTVLGEYGQRWAVRTDGGEGVRVRRANLVVLDTEEEKEEESLEQSWERMQASLAAGKAQRLAVDFSIDVSGTSTG